MLILAEHETVLYLICDRTHGFVVWLLSVLLLIVTPIVGLCNCPMFYCALLYVHSSFAIILMGKIELVALLCLSSWCILIVVGSSSRCHGWSAVCDCRIS